MSNLGHRIRWRCMQASRAAAPSSHRARLEVRDLRGTSWNPSVNYSARNEMETLLLLITFLLATAALVFLSLNRSALVSVSALVETVDRNLDRVDRSVQDQFRDSRRETSESVQRISDSLVHAQAAVGQAYGQQLQTFAN